MYVSVVSESPMSTYLLGIITFILQISLPDKLKNTTSLHVLKKELKTLKFCEAGQAKIFQEERLTLATHLPLTRAYKTIINILIWTSICNLWSFYQKLLYHNIFYPLVYSAFEQ